MAERTADDLLARLALVPRTLEARGLDVSPGIQAKLRQVGDLDAVAILDVILRDEIGHVALGVRWFAEFCAARGLEPVAHAEALRLAYRAPRPRAVQPGPAARLALPTPNWRRWTRGESRLRRPANAAPERRRRGATGRPLDVCRSARPRRAACRRARAVATGALGRQPCRAGRGGRAVAVAGLARPAARRAARHRGPAHAVARPAAAAPAPTPIRRDALAPLAPWGAARWLADAGATGVHAVGRLLLASLHLLRIHRRCRRASCRPIFTTPGCLRWASPRWSAS